MTREVIGMGSVTWVSLDVFGCCCRGACAVVLLPALRGREGRCDRPYAVARVPVPHDWKGRCGRPCYSTFAPKGIRESFAILNDCSPKGMPIMVMQLTAPAITYATAMGRPPATSQMMLAISEPAPPP